MAVQAAPYSAPLVDPASGLVTAPWLTWMKSVVDGISSSLGTAATTAPSGSASGSGSSSTASSVDAASVTGTTLAANVIFSSLTTLGVLSSLNVSGPSTLTGVYIPPTAASGGGAYADGFAIRWSTSPLYRTAIWRSDATGGAPSIVWNFENIGALATAESQTIQSTTQYDGAGPRWTVRQFSRASYARACAEFKQHAADPSATKYPVFSMFSTLPEQGSVVNLGIGTIGSDALTNTTTVRTGFSIFDGIGGAESQISVFGDLVSDSRYFERGRSVAMGDKTPFTPVMSSDVGSWTVGGGSVHCYYSQLGAHTWFVAIDFENTTITGSPTLLLATLPLTPAIPMNQFAAHFLPVGGTLAFDAFVQTTGSSIQISRSGGGTFPAGAGYYLRISLLLFT